MPDNHKSGLSNKLIIGIVITGLVIFFVSQNFVYAPDVGKLGGPISGLTPWQLKKFYETLIVFKKDFSPEEGLGPLFNGKSCFECHGKPTIPGGEGRDIVSTGVIRIGKRRGPKAKLPLNQVITGLGQNDVDALYFNTGPALQRKSITTEFPNKYPPSIQVEPGVVPYGAEFISMRHSPPLFGFGLIEAIPDADIVQNIFKEELMNPQLVGRAVTHIDPLTLQPRVGRFGWKDQNPTLFLFTTEALNAEMGITTFVHDELKSGIGIAQYPKELIKYLPSEPNDLGHLTAQLTYCQALLAPPERGPITPAVKHGEQIFNQLQCAVCHTPQMNTSPIVYIVDPDSPGPQLRYVEVQALENKKVHAYSDFLLHQMGVGLADGLPQSGARGGEWRTTPLFGLRFKKFYLHDGRTSNLHEAIMAHGGQAQSVTKSYEELPVKDRQDLLAFLQSL